MPTFRVICGNPSGQVVQLVIDAPDGVAARSVVQEAIADDWVIGLVQLDPDDPKFVQMQDHVTRQITSTNFILNEHTKLLGKLTNKIFGHWTLFWSILLALLIQVPVLVVLTKLFHAITLGIFGSPY